MAKIDSTWKRTEYLTWDEAFRGMAPAIRQQSVRVAAYSQALYVQACAENFGDKSEQIDGSFADLAYKCGLYHQLGKALVPHEYQFWQDDYTDEEKAVYRKYTTDGRLLVANLQERGVRAKERRKGELVELPTKNIPWLMLRESCEQHMERYDGSGFPAGRQGEDISLIAQIVGIAKELDRLASEKKAENPFADAYTTLVSQEGTLWSPELIKVLKAARPKCLNVYKKYIYYTMTVPKTIPLVDKRKDRPMGLQYRPMLSDAEGSVAAYEAFPWFGAVQNDPNAQETAEEVRELLRRTELVSDMAFYFLYEAADAVLRLENCKLDSFILLQMLPDFYRQGTQLKRFNQLFADQPIERSKLLITIPEEMVLTANKGETEIIERYLRNGIQLVLDGYHPDKIPSAQLKNMGFKYIRVAPELYLQQETANTMYLLRKEGFELIGGNAESHDILRWLMACSVKCASGTITGVMCSEDEFIREALLKEN